MERANFLLVAGTQFEPFVWARSEPKPGETDAEWEAKLPKHANRDAFARYADAHPVLYLYDSYANLWNELRRIHRVGEKEEQAPDVEELARRKDRENATTYDMSAVVALESLMMILKDLGFGKMLPIGRAPSTPNDRSVFGSWIYRKFQNLEFFRDATKGVASVLSRRFEFGLEREKKHASKPGNVPWRETDEGKTEAVEGLRLLLLSVYASLFAGRRDDLLRVVNDFVRKIEKESSPSTLFEDLPLFSLGSSFEEEKTIFVDFSEAEKVEAEDEPEDELEKSKSVEKSRVVTFVTLAKNAEEIAEKMRFVEENVPDLGFGETRHLRHAFEAAVDPPVEFGIHRFNSAVPAPAIWRGLEKLDVQTPRVFWIRYPKIPTMMTFYVAGGSAPLIDEKYDPESSKLWSRNHDRPMGIDRRLLEIVEYDQSEKEWMKQMTDDPKELYVATVVQTINRRHTLTQKIPLLENVDGWSTCFNTSESSASRITIERKLISIELDGEKHFTSSEVDSGEFTLFRLRRASTVKEL